MNLFTDEFTAAIRDYSHFVERDYPYKPLIKMIGDRYRLNSTQRSVLFRGIVKKETALSRLGKLTGEKTAEDNILHIDGYNVLITVASYLSGMTVFISNDGLLRDASESHGKIRKSELMDRSAELMCGYLKSLGIRQASVYLDKPVGNSAQFSRKIGSVFEEYGLVGSSYVVPSPDSVLKCCDSGICSTSDSAVIDGCKIPVFDLALNAIKNKFKPELVNLEDYIKAASRP
jgi:hypothetical protein